MHLNGTVAGAPSRLTRINSVVGDLTSTEYPIIPAGQSAVLVTCQSEIDVEILTNPAQRKVELYYPIDSWVDYLNVFNYQDLH